MEVVSVLLIVLNLIQIYTAIQKLGISKIFNVFFVFFNGVSFAH